MGGKRIRAPGVRFEVNDRLPARRLPLSVLELAPVGDGLHAGARLGSAVDLARLAERLGYRRLWVAEHHNMPGIASSSPPVLIAHLAAATTTIRVGAGGVMLPNHAALVVAEQFGMLEALHPGRIDLGLGRRPAPIRSPRPRCAARPAALGADEFPEQLRDLSCSSTARTRRSPRFPAAATGPRSGCSARATSARRLPARSDCRSRSRTTSRRRTPSPRSRSTATRSARRPSSQQPYAMIGVPVICADTDERARWLSGPSALSFVRLRQGRPTQLPTPEEAAEYVFTPRERELVRTLDRAAHPAASPTTCAPSSKRSRPAPAPTS